MQTRPWPFWLMIASMAIAVLPVWRSPMISSRWPRPVGVRGWIALTAVWAGVRGARAAAPPPGEPLAALRAEAHAAAGHRLDPGPEGLRLLGVERLGARHDGLH